MMHRSIPNALPCLLCAIACLMGCGSAPPARYVIERDMGPFFYRRYQKMLDVEFVVAGNPATGHTATYLRRGAGTPAFATAFVTVYAHAKSLSAEVKERLQQLQHYELAVTEVGGDYAFTLEQGDEKWAVWVSGHHVVKLGAPPSEPLPEELASAYMDAYPSDLDEHGRARDDADSRGPSRAQREQEREQHTERPAAEKTPRRAAPSR